MTLEGLQYAITALIIEYLDGKSKGRVYKKLGKDAAFGSSLSKIVDEATMDVVELETRIDTDS